MEARTGRRGQLQTALLAGLMLSLLVVAARSQDAVAVAGLSVWTAPTAIATGLPDAVHPSLTRTADGRTYAVWETSGAVYFAARAPGEAWSRPVYVAAGSEPGIVAGKDNVLHVVFSNQFLGDYEIYHVYRLTDGSWTLPVNVSHTSGDSIAPSLAADAQGGLHVTWTDKTSGRETIYYGRWNGQVWSSQPLPNARGQGPSIAAAADGTVFIAWQDRVPAGKDGRSVFDILLTEFANGAWSLPLDVSDWPDADSIGASIVATADSMAHVAWAEQGNIARYCFGKGTYLATVRTVAVAPAALRGPKIVAEETDLLRVGWDEGDAVRVATAQARAPTWPRADLVALPTAGATNVALAALPGGGATIAWVQANGFGSYDIYQSIEQPKRNPRIWIPLMQQ